MKYLLIMLLSVFLMACASTPKQEIVVTKIEYKVITIPDNLLKPCSVTHPPIPKEYIPLDYEQKENALTEYSISLVKDLKKCNSQITEISTYQDAQVKNIKESKK